MAELVKIHTYYIYSLNAFVVVFGSGIDLVQQRDKVAAAKEKSKKLKGIARLRAAATKVIMTMRRFPWNHDILREGFQASEEDMKQLTGFKVRGACVECRRLLDCCTNTPPPSLTKGHGGQGRRQGRRLLRQPKRDPQVVHHVGGVQLRPARPLRARQTHHHHHVHVRPVRGQRHALAGLHQLHAPVPHGRQRARGQVRLYAQ